MLYYFIYITFLIVGIAVSGYLIARLWTVRKNPGAYFLIWAIACVIIWSFSYIFEIALVDPGAKVVWLKAEYLGIPFVSLAIFSFILIYSGRTKWFKGVRFALFLVIPVISLIMALTNDWHHLLWARLTLPASLVGPITVDHGPWYIVNVIYSYSLLILAMLVLIQIAVRRHNIYRAQAVTMLIGLVIPWVGNLVYVLKPGLDWTPLAFTLTVIAFEVGFGRYRLMDILPITQNAAFIAMRDGVFVADLQGKLVEINPSAQSIFQKQGLQLIGQDIQNLLPAWDEWNAETSTAFEIDHEIGFGSGPTLRTFSLRISPILDHIGRVNGHMAILTDITDQKLAQAQMLLQVTALEAAENGIVITDIKGTMQWVNPAFTRLTGFTRQEALGKNPRILRTDHQSDEYYKNLWEKILSGKVWRGELINHRKDGSEYFEEMTITPLIQPDGLITNFIAIKQDISKRRLVEEQLQRAHEQAVQANRMKTQLLASVSHDLRTPLGAIMGYSEMLQTGVLGPVNAEQENAAASILDSANRLLAFVNNLIGQAQLETGRVVLRPASFKPSELADSIKSMVGFMIKKKGLTLEMIIDPALPGLIYADSYWLKQILHNLVNNAVKFTDRGTIKVGFFLKEQEHWAIQVTDTGVGIAADAITSIFEPFQQVEGKMATQGSGLGLSIVSQLATLINGKIELKSAVGQGSTFTLVIPLILPQESSND